MNSRVHSVKKIWSCLQKKVKHPMEKKNKGQSLKYRSETKNRAQNLKKAAKSPVCLPGKAQTNWVINWLDYFGHLLKCKMTFQVYVSHTLLCCYFMSYIINIRNLMGQAFDPTFSLFALLVKFASQQSRCSHQLSVEPPFISGHRFRLLIYPQRGFFIYLILTIYNESAKEKAPMKYNKKKT